MKKILVIVALLVVAAFPPCDFNGMTDTYEVVNGSYNKRSIPDVRNQGFKPIWEVGGRTVIRWPQLGLQLGVVAVAGFLVLGKKKAP